MLSSGISVGGESERNALSLRALYSWRYTWDAWLYFGLGAGWAHRSDDFTGSTPPDTVYTVSSSGGAFTYEFLIGIGGMLTEELHARLGYSYARTNAHGPFGDFGSHLLEFGVGRDL